MDWWSNSPDDDDWWRRQRPATTTTSDDEGGGIGSFFGGLSKMAGSVVDQGASFFGGMLTDMAKDAVTAGKTVAALGEGVADVVRSEPLKREADKLEKKYQEDVKAGKLSDEDRAKRRAEISKKLSEATGILENKNLEEIKDPLKAGGATAETFLNLVPGGAVVKQVGKQAAKKAVSKASADLVTKGGAPAITDLAETAAQQGTAKFAQQAEREAASRTAGGAAKTIGRNAFEGGMFGSTYGALDTLSREGAEANPEDIFRNALMGGAAGGVLGGAASFLDRNVRAGAREIPGEVRGKAGETAAKLSPDAIAERHPSVLGFDDQYKQLAEQYDTITDTSAKRRISQAMAQNRAARSQTLRQVREGGYVGDSSKDALGQAMDATDAAKRQLAGEPISGPDIAQDVASQYKSADEYIKDIVDSAMSREKSNTGGIKVPGADGGFVRTTEHAPWYSEMFAQTGRAPSKRAVRDEVQNALESGRPLNGLVEPEDAQVYQLLKARSGDIDDVVSTGPPEDLFTQFNNTLMGAPDAPAATRTPSAGRMPSGLPKGPQEGQAPLPVDIPAPYADAAPDFGLPMLPQGEIKTLSPKAAKAQFKRTGEAPEFVNTQRPGSKPTELPANLDDTRNIAMRETPSGQIKPLANNNAHISQDAVDAIRAISADETGSRFTATRTPEMNLEEAFAKRGGANSKEFRELSKWNQDIRDHSRAYAEEVDAKQAFLERFVREYNVNGKSAQDMRPFLEAGSKEASDEALKQYVAQYGKQAGDGLVKLRAWWRVIKDETRNSTNEQIERFAGKDRMIGDLGPTYVPRVYKRGMVKGFKDAVFDTSHAGMEKLGGKKGLFNLKSGDGYLKKESESMGGMLRNAEGIPLNSEVARPNTSYLSAAQKRTARTPQGELEDPLTSMMRYFEATARAKHYTEDIARGNTILKAIQQVENESGNMRQMYKSYEDIVNALSNKTSRLDRPFVDSKTGTQFVNVASKLQANVSKSTIVGSASSAMAQTGQLPLVAAETGAKNFQKGMQDMFKYLRTKKTAGDPLSESSLMRTRYRDFENAFKVGKAGRAGNKATDVIAAPFRVIERSATELAWRSSYNKALAGGLKGKDAIREADRITAKIVGERSPGARAALYESKAGAPITAYTLEVNQLYQVAKQYFKRDPKKAAALVGAIWIYNQGYKAVTGNKLNADPLQAGIDAAGILSQGTDDEGEPIGFGERVARAGGRIAGEAVDATPLGGPVAGQLYPEQGFRIPFGSGDRALSRADVFGDTNFGRYGGGTPLASGISNPLLLLGLPGMSQLQKSVEGNKAFSQGASMTPGGETRFDISQDPENFWRAILFGMYGTAEGQAYLRDQQARLGGR